MNIRQLNIFINVASTLSVTKTAKDMYLAQPSVSQAIKELEDEYNIKLFKRIKQRLVLTEAGFELVRYAKQVITDVNMFESKANNLSKRPKLNLASSLSIGENFLAKLIASYPDRLDFDMHINILISSSIIEGILKGDFDIGIIESSCLQKEIKKIKLLEDKLVVIAKKGYVDKKDLTLQDLTNYDLILRDRFSGTRLFIEDIFAKNNLNITPFCEASTNASVLDFVLNGLGIGILPASASNKLINEGVIEKLNILDVDLTRSISLIYLADKPLIKEEIKLIDYIRFNIKGNNV